MMMLHSGKEGGLSTLCGAEEKPCTGNIVYLCILNVFVYFKCICVSRFQVV